MNLSHTILLNSGSLKWLRLVHLVTRPVASTNTRTFTVDSSPRTSMSLGKSLGLNHAEGFGAHTPRTILSSTSGSTPQSRSESRLHWSNALIASPRGPVLRITG